MASRWRWSRWTVARIASRPTISKTRNVHVLTDGRQDEAPSFAPNGAILIYATRAGAKGTLAMVSADGRFQQRLSSDTGDVREPVWSPFPPAQR